MAFVSEVINVRLFKPLCLSFLTSLEIEISGVCGTVMLIDYVDDSLREMFLLGNLNAVLGMSCDYSDALHDRQIVVRIDSSVLILGEVLRVLELTDIVIIRCNLTEQRICTYSFCQINFINNDYIRGLENNRMFFYSVITLGNTNNHDS